MKKDILNKKYNSLLPIKYLGVKSVGNQGKTRGYWLCLCDCGNQTELFTGDITSGKTKTCGCRGVYKDNKRRCSICNEFKSLEEFSSTNTACKTCSNIRSKEYREKDIEHSNLLQREGYKRNREKRLLYAKNYRLKNNELLIQKCKDWRNLNPNYKKCRWKNDENYKITENLRGRIYKAIKNNSKSATTKELLGCTIDYLKIHLSKSFAEGMSWNNYGLWHIDHIKPCSAFDLSKEDEQKECFNYKNLQPLWAIDNLNKSNKYDKY